MTLVDQSIATVRSAVRRFRKKPLARKAGGMSDHILRNVDHDDWDPRSSTLRTLEAAAVEMTAEADAPAPSTDGALNDAPQSANDGDNRP